VADHTIIAGLAIDIHKDDGTSPDRA